MWDKTRQTYYYMSPNGCNPARGATEVTQESDCKEAAQLLLGAFGASLPEDGFQKESLYKYSVVGDYAVCTLLWGRIDERPTAYMTVWTGEDAKPTAALPTWFVGRLFMCQTQKLTRGLTRVSGDTASVSRER